LQSGGFVKGPRFCFLTSTAGTGAPNAVESFRQGCDVLVLDEDNESPAAVREQVAQAVSEAVAKGDLTEQQLISSSQRVAVLRSQASAPDGPHMKSAGAP
jgi:3-hydroxyacyl-CoA dehydrogenase